jgi:hypothetical protein
MVEKGIYMPSLFTDIKYLWLEITFIPYCEPKLVHLFVEVQKISKPA